MRDHLKVLISFLFLVAAGIAHSSMEGEAHRTEKSIQVTLAESEGFQEIDTDKPKEKSREKTQKIESYKPVQIEAQKNHADENTRRHTFSRF